MSEEITGMAEGALFDPELERIDDINERLRLIQKKNGLTFGTDAYMLSAFAKGRGEGKRGTVAAELGGGTGVASLLLLSRDKAERVWVYEVQSDFCSLMERNARLNGLCGRFTVINKDIRDAHPSDIEGECDIVISNPPYMKTDSGARNEHEEKYIARHEVFGDIFDFTDAAKRLLRYGGAFYCVYRPDRMIDLVTALRKCGLEPKLATFVHADSQSEPSMVLIEARKGGKPSLRITRPLFIYSDPQEDSRRGAREMSEDAKKIYDTCSFAEFLGK